jgi:hypothetical protein
VYAPAPDIKARVLFSPVSEPDDSLCLTVYTSGRFALHFSHEDPASKNDERVYDITTHYPIVRALLFDDEQVDLFSLLLWAKQDATGQFGLPLLINDIKDTVAAFSSALSEALYMLVDLHALALAANYPPELRLDVYNWLCADTLRIKQHRRNFALNAPVLVPLYIKSHRLADDIDGGLPLKTHKTTIQTFLSKVNTRSPFAFKSLGRLPLFCMSNLVFKITTQAEEQLTTELTPSGHDTLNLSILHLLNLYYSNRKVSQSIHTYLASCDTQWDYLDIFIRCAIISVDLINELPDAPTNPVLTKIYPWLTAPPSLESIFIDIVACVSHLDFLKPGYRHLLDTLSFLASNRIKKTFTCRQLIRLTATYHHAIPSVTRAAEADIYRHYQSLDLSGESWPPLCAPLCVNGVTLTPLTSQAALLEESNVMGHCVGTSEYDTACLACRSALFHVHHPKQAITAEFSLDLTQKTISLSHAEGKNMSAPCAEVFSALQTLVEMINQQAIDVDWQQLRQQHDEYRHFTQHRTTQSELQRWINAGLLDKCGLT